MTDADILRAQIATSTDPDRLEREARKAGMTLIERMARIAYAAQPNLVRHEQGVRWDPIAWDDLHPMRRHQQIMGMRAAVEVLRPRGEDKHDLSLPEEPELAAAYRALKQSRDAVAEYEIRNVITAYINTILTEERT